jgi:hypothetical protein
MKKMLSIANISIGEEYASALSSMSETICFDAESGLPLDYYQVLHVKAEAEIKTESRMTATNFALDSAEIKLPEDANIVEPSAQLS